MCIFMKFHSYRRASVIFDICTVNINSLTVCFPFIAFGSVYVLTVFTVKFVCLCVFACAFVFVFVCSPSFRSFRDLPMRRYSTNNCEQKHTGVKRLYNCCQYLEQG